MSNATGAWTVVVDGRAHHVAAEWDRYGSGGGRITVDGVVASRWRLGLKWPGAQQRFVVGGRELVVVKRGIADAQLDLYALEPGLGWPVAPPPSRGWLLLVAAVILVVSLLAAMAIVAVVVAP